MERYEMAELLSKKAGVSLEEARQALAENEWDILDAMVALERRRGEAAKAVEVDREDSVEYTELQPVKNASKREPVFTNGFAMIWHYIKRALQLSVESFFTVTRKDNTLISVPVLVLVEGCVKSFSRFFVDCSGFLSYNSDTAAAAAPAAQRTKGERSIMGSFQNINSALIHGGIPIDERTGMPP